LGLKKVWQCKHLQVPERGIEYFLHQRSLRKSKKKYSKEKNGRRQKKIQVEQKIILNIGKKKQKKK
jgi:hypothetical protein